jgi:AcrR family transcriptional regulator
VSATRRRHGRARSRRGEGERLRGEILAAAARLLVDSGSEEEVSIRAVAHDVGVTPPSIYLHFADKNELLVAVSEAQFAALDAYIESFIDGRAPHGDPALRLRLRGEAYVRFGLENPEPYRILFERKPRDQPAGFSDERLRQAACFDRLVGNVQGCIDAGLLRHDDAMMVSFTLWAVVHGITSLLIDHPEFPWPPVDTFIAQALDMVGSGINRPG